MPEGITGIGKVKDNLIYLKGPFISDAFTYFYFVFTQNFAFNNKDSRYVRNIAAYPIASIDQNIVVRFATNIFCLQEFQYVIASILGDRAIEGVIRNKRFALTDFTNVNFFTYGQIVNG